MNRLFLIILLISIVATLALANSSTKKKDCDCFRTAVSVCGSKRSSRACRRREVRRCFRKCRQNNALFAKKCKRTGARGCNCAAHAVTKCTNRKTARAIKCRNRHLTLCRRRCQKITPAIQSCECFLRSVTKCGAGGSERSRRCRNRFVRRCSRRCLTSRFLRVCNNKKVTRKTVRKTDLPPVRKNKTTIVKVERKRDTVRVVKRKVVVGKWKPPTVPRVLRREEKRRFEKITRKVIRRTTERENRRQRICISSNKCNCRTLARNECNGKADCYTQSLIKCQKRCAASKRCYNLACKNAGHRRCELQVTKLCTARFVKGEKLESCMQTERTLCRRYEACNCKRARSLFRLRGRCDLRASKKCGALSGAGKCKCQADIRAKCIIELTKKRTEIIRKFFPCEEAASLICSSETCGDLEKCLIREREKCQPVCERESRKLCKNVEVGECYDNEKKKCLRKWRKEYCDKTVLVKCDFDRGCVREEFQNCIVPKCETNCDDKNACTDDWCDPILGCRHRRKVCDDANACTLDRCDPVKGCVHTESVKCTARDCHTAACNPKTGTCEYKPQKDTPKCASKEFCKITDDCKAWGVKNNLDNICKTPLCDEAKGYCVAAEKEDKSKCSKCSLDCKPTNKCETAECIVGEKGVFTCVRRALVCKQTQECHVPKCDAEKGCVTTYTPGPKCPPNAKCINKVDCDKWAQGQDLKCKTYYCDEKLGACKTRDLPGCVTTKEECVKTCKPRTPCETAKCIDGENGTARCEFTGKTCTDGKTCTEDICDPKSGECKFIPTKKCPQGPCVSDKTCQPAKADKCLSYLCDLSSGECVTKKISSPECSNKEECEKSCLPRTACETSACVYDKEANKFSCKHTPRVCDDKKECTEDSCNVNSGCVHTYKVSRKCPPDAKCAVHRDCDAMTQRLKAQCKKAVCDEKLGACVVVDGDDKTCVPEEICKRACPSKNPCELKKCVKQNEKIVCQTITNKCDDGKECTQDSCDVKTGLCVNKFVKSDKCPEKCVKHAECVAYGIQQEAAKNCKTAYCDEKTGACALKVKSNCTPDEKVCKEKCPTSNPCLKAVCSYDTNAKFVCKFEARKCDDGKKCTEDSCDPKRGCVHTFKKSKECDTPCIQRQDCVKYEQDNKLPAKCQEAICDVTGACRAIMVINDRCCRDPKVCSVSKCEKECQPRHKCEEARCIFDGETKKFECQRLTVHCDDKKTCTEDSCDPQKGCVFTFKKTQKCTTYCEERVDCLEYSKSLKLASQCKTAFCNRKTGSCQISKKVIPGCDVCKKSCFPRNACETAVCKKDPKFADKYYCSRKPRSCDDKKSCTEDSCDNKRGCVHTFKKTEKCPQPCLKDLDCVAWGTKEALADKCYRPVCDLSTGACKAVQGPITDKCRTVDVCKSSKDCPPSEYGSTCCLENGVRKCCKNECQYDLDCQKRNPSPQEKWAYCKKRSDTGVQKCSFEPKCVSNKDCDDKQPCTEDVCIQPYGKCVHKKRCVDNTECTEDICIPSPDGKSYQCRNPIKTCTNDKNLLTKNLAEVKGREEKEKWLGKCSHTEGCVTCVVSAQCDDNNGCTADSCEQQFCLHRPIHNEFCDPKLASQPIFFQSKEDLRRAGILAGYDVATLNLARQTRN